MIEARRQPSTRILQQESRKDGYSAVINSRFYLLKGPICHIRRHRIDNEAPMMLEDRSISLTLCRGMDPYELELHDGKSLG